MQKLVLSIVLSLSAVSMAGPLHAEEMQTMESHSETSCYTCRMHKQIKESKPGKCPICKMTLIPCPEPETHNESDHKHDA